MLNNNLGNIFLNDRRVFGGPMSSGNTVLHLRGKWRPFCGGKTAYPLELQDDCILMGIWDSVAAVSIGCPMGHPMGMETAIGETGSSFQNRLDGSHGLPLPSTAHWRFSWPQSKFRNLNELTEDEGSRTRKASIFGSMGCWTFSACQSFNKKGSFQGSL